MILLSHGSMEIKICNSKMIFRCYSCSFHISLYMTPKIFNCIRRMNIFGNLRHKLQFMVNKEMYKAMSKYLRIDLNFCITGLIFIIFFFHLDCNIIYSLKLVLFIIHFNRYFSKTFMIQNLSSFYYPPTISNVSSSLNQLQ